MKCEYFLPSVVTELLEEEKATVTVLTSKDKWYGVTYKEDKPVVMAAIKDMKDNGVYPEQVWCGRSEAIVNFQIEGMVMSAVPYGSGHINDTFLMTLRKDDGSDGRVILQRMNTKIFEPVKLMQNIFYVTSYLRKVIIENGGDPDRET